MPPTSNAQFARTLGNKGTGMKMYNIKLSRVMEEWEKGVRIRCHFKDTELGGVDSSLDLDFLKGMPPATEIQIQGSEMNFALRICCCGFPGNH